MFSRVKNWYITHTHTHTNTHTNTHTQTHVYLLASFVSLAHCRVQCIYIFMYLNTHKYTLQDPRQGIYLYSKQVIRSVGPQQATDLAIWLRNGSSEALSKMSWVVCRLHRVTVLAGFRLDRKRPYPNDLH
jgi:hypothetical protein